MGLAFFPNQVKYPFILFRGNENIKIESREELSLNIENNNGNRAIDLASNNEIKRLLVNAPNILKQQLSASMYLY